MRQLKKVCKNIKNSKDLKLQEQVENFLKFEDDAATYTPAVGNNVLVFRDEDIQFVDFKLGFNCLV